MFFHRLGIIIPIDELIFLRGFETSNQMGFGMTLVAEAEKKKGNAEKLLPSPEKTNVKEDIKDRARDCVQMCQCDISTCATFERLRSIECMIKL